MGNKCGWFDATNEICKRNIDLDTDWSVKLHSNVDTFQGASADEVIVRKRTEGDGEPSHAE